MKTLSSDVAAHAVEPAGGPNRLRHMPALDGLRAIAVVAVILYHSGVSWMPGGFLGVDLFFVLSGYLITTLLIRERESTGRIDLRQFWIRRFRRLIPALLLVLVAVAAYAHFVVSPSERHSLRWDGLASLGYVANWRFILTKQSYFGGFATPSPMKHMWSLAVEEQWYLVWPVLFGALLHWFRGRLSAVLGVVLALASASIVAMRILTPRVGDPSRAYYGTDTRAHTLLLGSALALIMHNRRIRSLGGRLAVQVGGLVGLVVLVAVFVNVNEGDQWLYRKAGFALFAVAGAVVILAAIHPVPGPVQWLLKPAPLQFIGRISYGLYLWHWPVDIFVTTERFGLRGLGLFACRVALTFAIAMLSYHLLEIPVRTGRAWSFKPLLTAASSGLVTACLLLVGTTGGASALQVAGAAADGTTVQAKVVIVPQTLPSTTAPSFSAPVDPSAAPPTQPGRDVRLAVVGDSVAFTFAINAPQVRGLKIMPFVGLGCGIVAGGHYLTDTKIDWSNPTHCRDWSENWRLAGEARPDVALISLGAWEVDDQQVNGRRLRVGTAEYRALVLQNLEQGLSLLNAHGKPRVAMFNVPCYRERDEAFGGNAAARNRPERVRWVNGVFDEFMARHGDQVTMIDYAGFACPRGRFIDKVDGITLRPDGVHYNPTSSPILWRWLAPQLLDLAHRPGL